MWLLPSSHCWCWHWPGSHCCLGRIFPTTAGYSSRIMMALNMRNCISFSGVSQHSWRSHWQCGCTTIVILIKQILWTFVLSICKMCLNWSSIDGDFSCNRSTEKSIVRVTTLSFSYVAFLCQCFAVRTTLLGYWNVGRTSSFSSFAP